MTQTLEMMSSKTCYHYNGSKNKDFSFFQRKMGRGGGFPTDRLLTNENLIEEFLCPICVQLVEAPVITACSHVFCRPCM